MYDFGIVYTGFKNVYWATQDHSNENSKTVVSFKILLHFLHPIKFYLCDLGQNKRCLIFMANLTKCTCWNMYGSAREACLCIKGKYQFNMQQHFGPGSRYLFQPSDIKAQITKNEIL